MRQFPPGSGSMRKTILCAALLLSSTFPAGCVSTSLALNDDTRVSQERFLALNAAVSRVPAGDVTCLDRQDAKPDGGNLAWCESYALNDLVDRFEHNGDSRSADEFLAHVRRVQAHYNTSTTDTVRGRVVGGWMSTQYSDGRPHVWAVHTGMIAAPMARFAAIVGKRNAIAYQNDARALTAFAARAFLEMEGDWKNNQYRYPGDGMSRPKGSPLPYNMQAAMGLLALQLYRASGGNQVYLSRVKTIARTINDVTKERIVGGKRRLAWPYETASGPEDTSHAILTMRFITRAHQAGIIFSKRRYQAILTSFLEGAIGTGSVVNGNLVSIGHGGDFADTCHRALLIYRHHAPTFNRCQINSS